MFVKLQSTLHEREGKSCFCVSVTGVDECCQNAGCANIATRPLGCLQGRRLSETGDAQESLSDVERVRKPGNTELAFSAEGKMLSCRFYVSDGLVHGLPPSAKEVWPSVCPASPSLPLCSISKGCQQKHRQAGFWCVAVQLVAC